MKTNLIGILLSMTLVNCAHSKPLIIAHRGASGYLPEHTLPSVTLAYGMGADYIEQDVVLTKDNQPVILHDIHLDTVTNVAEVFPGKKRKDGRYYAIDLTLKEIKKLRVQERFDLKTKKAVFPNRFSSTKVELGLPTLQEEIELIQNLNRMTHKNVGIYVELKAPEFHLEEGKDISEVVLTVLNEYGYGRKNSKAYIQCFHADTLKKIRSKTPLKLIQLIGENSWKESSTNYDEILTLNGLVGVSKYADGIGPWLNHFYDSATDKQRGQLKQYFKLALSKGLEVHPYTFRKEQLPPWAKSIEDLKEFLFSEAKVGGVFTDYPDFLDFK